MRSAKFWATVVAEAEAREMPHERIAARHGVTTAALKYHLYKARRAGAAEERVEILPVRLAHDQRRQSHFEVELESNVRLRFSEGSDPEYVASLVWKLRSRPC
jgi:hypothetical protein